MTGPGIAILFHGTDLDSALIILEHGLDTHQLRARQGGRRAQLGPGWYTTDDITAAWFFASIAPGNVDKGFTIIQVELFVEHLEMLLQQGLAKKSKIANVWFDADQYRFDPQAFPFLNEYAVFRPYLQQEEPP
jgi:hypothetical protein